MPSNECGGLSVCAHLRLSLHPPSYPRLPQLFSGSTKIVSRPWCVCVCVCVCVFRAHCGRAFCAQREPNLRRAPSEAATHLP